MILERIYEDHEMLVSNLLLWSNNTKNKIFFLDRHDKYDLFIHPEIYLLSPSEAQPPTDLDDDQRSQLIEVSKQGANNSGGLLCFQFKFWFYIVFLTIFELFNFSLRFSDKSRAQPSTHICVILETIYIFFRANCVLNMLYLKRSVTFKKLKI